MNHDSRTRTTSTNTKLTDTDTRVNVKVQSWESLENGKTNFEHKIIVNRIRICNALTVMTAALQHRRTAAPIFGWRRATFPEISLIGRKEGVERRRNPQNADGERKGDQVLPVK